MAPRCAEVVIAELSAIFVAADDNPSHTLQDSEFSWDDRERPLLPSIPVSWIG